MSGGGHSSIRVVIFWTSVYRVFVEGQRLVSTVRSVQKLLALFERLSLAFSEACMLSRLASHFPTFSASAQVARRAKQYVCMYVCVCVCMYVCLHVRMHACIYASMHLCIYASMHVCMHVCMI